MTKKKRWIVIFLAPGLLLFVFVFLISIVQLGITSFTDWTIGTSPTFAGLKNYIYQESYSQYNYLDCASINNTCLHWYDARAYIEKKKMVYKSYERGIYDPQYYFQRGAWNVVFVYYEPTIWNGKQYYPCGDGN